MAHHQVLAIPRPIGDDLESFGKLQQARSTVSVDRLRPQLICRWRRQERVIDMIVGQPIASQYTFALGRGSQVESRSRELRQVIQPE